MINTYRYIDGENIWDANPSKIYMLLPDFKLYMKRKDDFKLYKLDLSNGSVRIKQRKNFKSNVTDWCYEIESYMINNKPTSEVEEKATGIVEADSFPEFKEYLVKHMVLTELVG